MLPEKKRRAANEVAGWSSKILERTERDQRRAQERRVFRAANVAIQKTPLVERDCQVLGSARQVAYKKTAGIERGCQTRPPGKILFFFFPFFFFFFF